MTALHLAALVHDLRLLLIVRAGLIFMIAKRRLAGRLFLLESSDFSETGGLAPCIPLGMRQATTSTFLLVVCPPRQYISGYSKSPMFSRRLSSDTTNKGGHMRSYVISRGMTISDGSKNLK